MDDLDPHAAEAEEEEIALTSDYAPDGFYVGDADDYIWFDHPVLREGQVVLTAHLHSPSMQIYRGFEEVVCPPDEVVNTAKGMVKRAITWCDKQGFIATNAGSGIEWVFALASRFAIELDEDDICLNRSWCQRETGRVGIGAGAGDLRLGSVNDEYAWLNRQYPGWTMIQERRVDVGGVPFDIVSIRTAERQEYDIYFNISAFYGKEAT